MKKKFASVCGLRLREGSILIVTIWALVFFSILSVALYKLASPQMQIAKVLKQRTVARYLAKAAYVSAVLARYNDESIYDTLAELRTPVEIKLGDGTAVYKLIDEESKININTASEKIIMRLPEMNADLAEAIIESELRPFHFKEEILRVEGMSEEVYDKIKDYITVYGNGRVNINTASGDVLALLGMEDDLIEVIKYYRAGDDGEEATDDDREFESVSAITEDLEDATGGLLSRHEAFITQLIAENLIDVSSNYFSLEVDARVLGRPVIKYAILMDEKKIYQWQEE